MQISPETVKQFPQELQICREFCLLGNYDTCLLYFESLLSTIHIHAKSQTPEEAKKWMALKEMLMVEFNLVKEIHQELNSFKDRRILNTEKVDTVDKDVWPAPEPMPTSNKKTARRSSKGELF
jgi:katanin p60 ATPase-containing subunit A1